MVMASRARLIAIVALCVMTASMHAAFASAPIVVVATTSDIASLVSAVGGEVVQVKTIVPPGTDPEAFEPRVSDLSMLSDADLIVRVGLGYDLWIDKLIIQLHRPEFQAGAGARWMRRSESRCWKREAEPPSLRMVTRTV